MFFVIVFALTTIGGLALLTLAIWPGLLGDVVFGFPFFLLSLPAFGIWFLLPIGLGLLDLAGGRRPLNRRRWGLWSGEVMFVTLALLYFNVPRRVAFAFCFSEFKSLADQVPNARVFEKQVDTKVGPYWIDVCASDSRGGVFLRTHTGSDGLGPDIMSYGFALRPNREGTPFGNAHYQRGHLFGDWYAFAASDDW